MSAGGTCEPRFAEVGEEFERNLAERGDLGAAVCVTVDGETVVDLWGGVADVATGRPWTEDTVTPVWSCTKGATALCAHILASRAELDFGAPVATYWPEFAKNGKADIPVRMLLNHQAGLAALREPLPPGGLCDWDAVIDALAGQQPLWAPGTRSGYHALTFGHLVGEVVRRVSGASPGTFFRQEVADPLGIDFWIGLPEEHEPRVAPSVAADMPAPGDPLPSFYQLALEDPASIPGMVLFNCGGFMDPVDTMDRQQNTRAGHAAEIPAVNGITNGRGLAGMYRPLALGGAVDGVQLVDRAQIASMAGVTSASSVDATVQVPTRWTSGFHPSVDNRWLGGPDGDSFLLSADAFGHSGMGGSLGFADAPARLSFGYTMTKQGAGIAIDERAQSMVDAVYRALGYRRPEGGGIWLA